METLSGPHSTYSKQGTDPITEQLNRPAGRRPALRVHLRRSRAALPAHVESEIRPSPAAEPHDAAAWLPVPDPLGLPSIETLLEEATPVFDLGSDTIDLAAIEATVAESPARAEPHDAAAWLPLPDDVDDLPPVEALLDPDPQVQAAVVAEAEAVVADALAAAEASSAPSPARAEPHDAAAWLPLPVAHELPAVTDLLEDATPPPTTRRRQAGPTACRRPGRSGSSRWWSSRSWPAGGRSPAPRTGRLEVTLLVDGTRQEMRTEAESVGALLKAQHVSLGRGDVVVPSAGSALHDGLHVDVLRSFPVTVDVDGTTRTVRTSRPPPPGSPTSSISASSPRCATNPAVSPPARRDATAPGSPVR